MSTSVKELKTRLREFLDDPSQESSFRVWFAHALRDAHKANSLEFESLAHTVQRAFSDAAEGVYTPAELMEMLTELSEPVVASQMVPFNFSGSFSFPLVWRDELPSAPPIMLVEWTC